MSPRVSIREQLTAATCALVGTAAPAAVDAVEFDASLLYWTEGSRVTVNETVLHLRKPLAGERVFSLGFALDVMTGASANGAIPANQPQTFTRPSGRGGYIVLPGATPMDDTFQDNRVAVTAGLETPLGRNAKAVVDGHFSTEYDYDSAGIAATLTRDLNKRNTTIALGGAFTYDAVSPEGGTPLPFASMRAPGEHPLRQDRSDNKTVADLLVGVTQVLDRSTLARVNYTLSHASGYHTDPFKLLTVVDDAGSPADYVFENRPDRRTRHSVYGILKRHLARDVVEASYRYMRDDWGIRSHTVEARYRWEFGDGKYLQPQYRFYHQTAADFFTPFLVEGEETPDHASADYRLDELDAHTLALKYGVVIDEAHEINVRIGYYLQKGERGPPASFTELRGLDLFPDVDAYVIQLGYTLYAE